MEYQSESRSLDSRLNSPCWGSVLLMQKRPCQGRWRVGWYKWQLRLGQKAARCVLRHVLEKRTSRSSHLHPMHKDLYNKLTTILRCVQVL